MVFWVGPLLDSEQNPIFFSATIEIVNNIFENSRNSSSIFTNSFQPTTKNQSKIND